MHSIKRAFNQMRSIKLVPVMGQRKILLRSQRHHLGWVDGDVAGVVVLLDMGKVHRLRHPWPLI